MSHTFYIVAGCNGAGKTTAFKYQLSRNTHISDADFINPDEVAHELCPQDVDRAQYQAGRACLERFPMMLETGEDFCMETTLASRTFQSRINEAHAAGYRVHLYFYYLSSPEHAIKRVEQRVAAGGHDIQNDILVRRFTRGIAYLLDIYKDIVDYWRITDNSQILPHIIADSERGVLDMPAFEKLRQLALSETSLSSSNQRPFLNIPRFSCLSDSTALYDVNTSETTIQYIKQLIEDKARNNEKVVYSVNNTLVVLSASDVKWLFQKLFVGIEEWEYRLLVECSRRGKNMIYQMDECDVSIPADLVLNLLYILSPGKQLDVRK